MASTGLHVLIRYLLSFRLCASGLRMRYWSNARGQTVNEVENVDRLTCLRQDDLDLVFPPSASGGRVIRMVVPLQTQDTGRDLFISVKDIQIKSLAAVVYLTRIDDVHFGFEVVGGDKYQGDEQAARIDFWLSGFELLTQSTAIDWAASLAAGRDELRKGQSGQLHFKLSGKARGYFNKATLEWELDLVDAKADLFQFKITNQKILEVALTDYGGIDEVLLEQVVWPAVKMILPTSLAASLQFIHKPELDLKAEASVSGSMVEPNADLNLIARANITFDVVPAKILEVFMKEFNITEIAEQQVDTLLTLLSSNETKAKVEQNRKLLLKTMETYGWAREGGPIREFIENASELESLRPRLMEIAKNSADKLLLSLQPFVKAHAHGKDGIFQGLKVGLAGTVRWNKGEHGLISASLQTPNHSHVDDLMVLPKTFLETFFSPQDSGLKVRANHTTEFKFNEFDFHDGHVKLSNMSFQDVLIDLSPNTTNATQGQSLETSHILRIDGAASDFIVKLPSAWDAGVRLSAQEGRVTQSSQGDVSVAMGPKGFVFEELPHATVEKRGAPLHVRTGPVDSLDGVIPPQFARPEKLAAPLDRLTVAPVVSAQTSVQITGRNPILTANATAEVTTTINISHAMRSILAERSSLDFGYVFMKGTFERRVVGGEKGVAKASTVYAVISCGYLRLLRIGSASHDVQQLLDMRPKNGQLELDIAKYESVPEIDLETDGHACLLLYSSGYQPRLNKGWGFGTPKDVEERLCGSIDKVTKLKNAIALQITRFSDPRAREWNFGTHEAGTPQYELIRNGAVSNPNSHPSSFLHQRISTFSRMDLQPAQLEFKGAAAELLQTREPSPSRKKCWALDELDRKAYPPEKHGQKAIRIAVPLPTFGNLHAVVDKIELTKFELKVEINRTSNNTFSLEVTGSANAWIEGLDFTLPKSFLDEGMEFVANLERFTTKMMTFGVYANRGRLDEAPVDVRLKMGSNFTTDENGKWIISGKSSQDAKIHFGQGGMVHGLINHLIKKAGGIDQIFFESIWPVVMQLIPDDLGAAFQAAPLDAGKIGLVLNISGTCKQKNCTKKVGCKCPAEELDIIIDFRTDLEVSPKPIIDALVSKPESDGEWSRWLLDNVRAAYGRKEHVFAGAKMSGEFGANLTSDKELDVKAAAKTSLPMALLNSGPDSPLHKFIPGHGGLLAAGSLELKDEIISIPAVRIRNVRLPIILQDGSESINFSANLGPLTAQVLSDYNTTGPKLIPPIEIHAPEYVINVSRDGITARFSDQVEKAKALTLRVEPPLVKKTLLEATATAPLNTRTAPKGHADGKLPPQFSRPFARSPAKLNLPDLIKQASLELWITRREDDLQQEFLDVDIGVNASATLRIGRDFWRSLLDTKDEDFGYVHYRLIGRYGSLRKSSKIAPKTVAFAQLWCGTLLVYKVRSNSTKPFKKTEVSVDTYAHPTMGNNLTDIQGLRCMKVPVSGWTRRFWRSKYFCGAPDAMSELKEGLELQKERFGDIPNRIRDALAANISKTFKTMLQAESRDGTWFKELNASDPSTYYPDSDPPKDAAEVQSPRSAWKALLSNITQFIVRE